MRVYAKCKQRRITLPIALSQVPSYNRCMANATKHNAATLLLAAHKELVTTHPDRALLISKRIATVIRGDSVLPELRIMADVATWLACAVPLNPGSAREQCAIMLVAGFFGLPVSDPTNILTADMLMIVDQLYVESSYEVRMQLIVQLTDLVRAA